MKYEFGGIQGHDMWKWVKSFNDVPGDCGCELDLLITSMCTLTLKTLN